MMNFDLQAMIAQGRFMQPLAIQTRQYQVKNNTPLPKGYFSVKLHEVSRYIGKGQLIYEVSWQVPRLSIRKVTGPPGVAQHQ